MDCPYCEEPGAMLATCDASGDCVEVVVTCENCGRQAVVHVFADWFIEIDEGDEVET